MILKSPVGHEGELYYNPVHQLSGQSRSSPDIHLTLVRFTHLERSVEFTVGFALFHHFSSFSHCLDVSVLMDHLKIGAPMRVCLMM